MELAVLKAAVGQVREEYAFSQRRACRLLTMSVSSYRYQSRRSDEGLRLRLVELAREKPRFGYRRLHVLLRRSGEDVNHKRVHRVYREAGLSIRRKKRKHCVRTGQPLRVCTAANQEWALDFVHDAVESGRAIRVLSVVDAYTRECLALQVDTSFASRRVTRVLEGIMAERGVPQAIRCDNGPELTSRHFLAWCIERKIELVHIQPGRPMQNGRVESFNGRMREECLNVSWFGNLFEARERIAVWRREYNEERPHSSLGYRTPEEFAREIGGERAVEKTLSGKVKTTFPLRLEIPQKARDFHFPTAPAATVHLSPSRLTVRMSYYDVCGIRGQVSRSSHAFARDSRTRVISLMARSQFSMAATRRVWRHRKGRFSPIAWTNLAKVRATRPGRTHCSRDQPQRSEGQPLGLLGP